MISSSLETRGKDKEKDGNDNCKGRCNIEKRCCKYEIC